MGASVVRPVSRVWHGTDWDSGIANRAFPAKPCGSCHASRPRRFLTGGSWEGVSRTKINGCTVKVLRSCHTPLYDDRTVCASRAVRGRVWAVRGALRFWQYDGRQAASPRCFNLHFSYRMKMCLVSIQQGPATKHQTLKHQRYGLSQIWRLESGQAWQRGPAKASLLRV